MVCAPLKIGSVVGERYRIESLLGRGALGTVYRCRDIRNKSLIALKLLRSRGPGVEDGTLQREFSILGRLRHPNLVRILDFGRMERSSGSYIVQEYVEGRDLFEASAGWSVEQVLEVLAGLCRAVQFLHDRGVLHGDLKPGNVLFTGSPSGHGQLKVLDFGLARWLAGEEKRTVEGTPAYTAPEVFLGREAGRQADLYSLGIMFYQMLARRLPFEEEHPGCMINKHLQGQADMHPIERLEHGPGLARVIARLLEKEPERRPASAEEVIRLLGAASGRDLSAQGAPGGEFYFSSGTLVGREAEMGLLQQRARQVRETGRGWTLFVVGESGSGKSRCMEELRIWALLEGWRVVQGRCTAVERRVYGPYREVLDSAKPLPPDSSRRTPESNPLLEPPRAVQTISHRMAAESTASQFRDQLTREIVGRLTGEPTLVLLHDFHWADEAATAILDYLTSDILAHSILLCVSARPSEAEQNPFGRLVIQAVRRLRGEKLLIEPLSKDAVIHLISTMTGQEILGQRLGEWVSRTVGGNPFFVEETLKYLVDRGILKRERGRWKLEKFDPDERRAPETVAAVLRRRLSQLSERASEVACWLAVIKRPAASSLLETVVPGATDVLESSLEELVQRQIARTFDSTEGRTYDFCNASIADVVLEDLPPRRKREMHRAVGQALERQEHGERQVEIASHFIAGSAGKKGVDCALKAAGECKAESAHEMLLRFSKHILEKGRHLPIDRLCEIAIDAGEACCALGKPDAGVRILKRRLEISRKGPPIIRARLLMQLAACYQHLGRLKELDDACHRSLKLLCGHYSELEDVTRAIVYRHLAYATTVRYRRRQGLVFLNKALEALERHDLVASILGGRIHIMIAVAHWTECKYRESIAAAKRAVGILGETQANRLLSQAHSMLGMGLIGLGKFRLARQQEETALAVADKCRSVMTRLVALADLVESVCRFGHVQHAAGLADQILELMSEVRNPVIVYECCAVVSEAKVTFGDYGGARELLGGLQAVSPPGLAVHSRGQVLYLTALLDHLLGNNASALVHLDELRRLHRQKGPVLEYELGEAIRAAILHSRGYKTKAKALLLDLDSRLRRRGWPYHTCIVNLMLGEILLEGGELGRARRCVRWALKLSEAMPSRHLNSRAHLLQARGHRMAAAHATAEADQPERRLILQRAREEVRAALKLAGEAGVHDLVWPVHAEWARIEEELSEWQDAADHSRRALEHLAKAQEKVALEDEEGFLSALARGPTRSECESLLARIRAMEAQDALPPAVLA